MILTGKTWCFGDNIDTDLMYPGAAFRATPEERKQLFFSANRPGWAHQVHPGDLLVAGRNFGTGSGRPATTVLADLGIVGIVAETINGLFLRNCVNAGLPAIECPDVLGGVREGDVITVDFAAGTVRNTARDITMQGSVLPPELIDIVQSGGILPRLRAQGYIS